MESNPLPDFSPEQEFAHKLAAQELAKYCLEFSCWQETNRAGADSNKILRGQDPLRPISTKKPDPPAPH